MGNIQQLKALAKINLGLDVLGRRENGYHDVRMVMQTIYLYDNITIQRTETPGITLESNLYFLPNDEGNIAYKAAKMLMDEFEIRDGPYYIGQAYPGGSRTCRGELERGGGSCRNEPYVFTWTQ